jgi:hypothetical protein
MGTGSTNLSSPKRTEKFELGTLSNRLNLVMLLVWLLNDEKGRWAQSLF